MFAGLSPRPPSRGQSFSAPPEHGYSTNPTAALLCSMHPVPVLSSAELSQPSRWGGRCGCLYLCIEPALQEHPVPGSGCATTSCQAGFLKYFLETKCFLSHFLCFQFLR